MMTIDNIHYYNMDEITSGLDTGDIYFTKSGEGSGELTFILTVPETKHCYLYVNSSAFDSIEIGKNGEIYTQDTDEAYIYDLGIVTPEQEISVLIKIENEEYGYIDFYPYYVNDIALTEGYNILNQNSLNVTSFEETKIKGTINAPKDCVFYSSIPYDTGWTVKIDGKEIAQEDYINLVESYLCFNLPAGEHEIEITFMQDGLILGLGITAATIVLLIAAAIFFAKKRKNQPVYALPAAPVVLTDDDIITEVDMQLDEEEITEGESEEEISEDTAEEENTETEEAVEKENDPVPEEIPENEAVEEDNEEKSE